ncbi:universal stress protein [Paraburkholderia phosphatilytica]|uniref:universal stress protein n=1 Tax=Paraburkholderia phosphatilytica TaxID=2282883 RepID=UPI000E48D393|nr:universal stress protein [Paraburkholderia phosphatilytica]
MMSFHRVLLCYDATREGQKALREAAALVELIGSETHVLSILNDAAWLHGTDVTAAEPFDTAMEAAQALLKEGLAKLEARGIHATGHFAVGDPMERIPAFAKELDVDLLVVGHRHSSPLARWWAGRNDGRLLDKVSCSVLVTTSTKADAAPAPA